MNLLVVSILILELLLIGFGIYLIFSFINKTPFYPSSIRRLNEFKESGIIDFSRYKNFIDIGSGDGRIMRWAAKNQFKKVAGVEYNPYLSLYSRLRSLRFKNVKTINGNFHHQDYSDYDLVYMYIFSEHMDQLKDRLFSQLKPGSVIVTNTFRFSDMAPDLNFKKFYVYKVR